MPKTQGRSTPLASHRGRRPVIDNSRWTVEWQKDKSQGKGHDTRNRCDGHQKTYGESSTLFRPLIFDRDMTINFPHRLHLITSPTGSSRAVIRPQMQRTSFPEAGRPVLLMSISQVNKGHDPFTTMTYEIDETSPAKLIPTSRRLAHTKQCLSAPNNVSE